MDALVRYNPLNTHSRWRILSVHLQRVQLPLPCALLLLITMLILISPAKTLDFESPAPKVECSEPEFLVQSQQLAGILQKMSAADLGTLMSISQKLSDENFQRYQNWQQQPSAAVTRPAVYAFQGDVYQGLQADQWKAPQRKKAGQSLRILSGLYGLLRPFDSIQPYRLEMGTRLKTSAGGNLYEFWGDRLTQAVNETARELRSNWLVNLASQEYFRSVRSKRLEPSVVTPVFKDLSNGKYRVISFFAKQARGRMADWILRSKVTSPEDLTGFNVDGYEWQEGASTPAKPVFHRQSAP